MKLRIGNVELDNNLILAPMAGVTDMSFRQLCREQGCGLLVTEMVSAKAPHLLTFFSIHQRYHHKSRLVD